MIVDDMYVAKCGNIEKYESDINQLLPTIHKYAKECEHITEMGVRGIVSTWAFLAARPKRLISYDIADPKNWGGDISYTYKAAEEAGVSFTFIQKNVLDVEIEETDMLFIDTLHNYNQMKKELALHGNKARKYLVFHDTQTNRTRGETEGVGIWPAIEEFMKENPHWTIQEQLEINNGLTVLVRNNP